MTANEGTRREKRGRGLSVPVIMRMSDCAVRFLLAAVLAGAELMGGHAPFALALVGVCGALGHNLAQLVVAWALTSGAVLFYVPFLGVYGLVTGILTGTVLKLTLPALERVGKYWGI